MLEHVLIAERALGHALPAGAVVHHVNEQTLDNRPSNLVICQDGAYHQLLHSRMRVLRAGGNPNTQKQCGSCGEVKSRDEFYPAKVGSFGTMHRCKACGAAHNLVYTPIRRSQRRVKAAALAIEAALAARSDAA